MPGIDAATLAAIDQRAQELVDAAPPLTDEQVLLLVSLFSRYDDAGVMSRDRQRTGPHTGPALVAGAKRRRADDQL